MFTICQHFYFIVGGMFYKNREDCGVVSDCEELVGYLQGMMGLDYCFVPDELYLTRKMISQSELVREFIGEELQYWDV